MSATSDSWNPAQYERFRNERSQPFFDLLALIRQRPEMKVVDLGCGSGELTRELHRALSARSTLGIDTAASMLSQSNSYLEPGLALVKGDIADSAPSPLMTLSSQTLPCSGWTATSRFLPGSGDALIAGGQLAIQMPANDDHPSHRAAAEVAQLEPYQSALGGYVRPRRVLAPEAHAAILHALGFGEQHVRLQVYGHVLESRQEVVEWVRGTLLTDYR